MHLQGEHKDFTITFTRNDKTRYKALKRSESRNSMRKVGEINGLVIWTFVTRSFKHSPSEETNASSKSKKISSILQNTQGRYHVHMTLPLTGP
jgi:hypothetical protein